MPMVFGESSTIPEQIRYRKPRNQLILDTDPSPPQMPSIIQSARCKSSISSLLFSTFTPSTSTTDNPITTTAAAKKKNFASATFRGLGCTASSQVSVPAVIRTSANWEAKKVRKKKQRSLQQKKNRAPSLALPIGAVHNGSNNPSSSSNSSSLVVPDVWCGPGIGLSADAASVDCVVSRRPVSGRGKVDGEKMNQRERERSSCSVRRMVTPEDISFLDPDPPFGMSRSRFDAFGPRHHRHIRHHSPEGLAEIVMFQSQLLMGGRSDGLDRYRDWRLDVDNMSYEELLELGDRIGHVSTGLREDEVIRCLWKTKLSVSDNLSSHFPTKTEWKCSICQEEYEVDDMGKLDWGHFFHTDCIKQWLIQKSTCPICKTEAVSQC